MQQRAQLGVAIVLVGVSAVGMRRSFQVHRSS
jgi:hypothetical protein